MGRKQAEEALANALQADKAKAADLRTAYQQHQDDVNRIKRDCEKDIRRLVRPCEMRTTSTNIHYIFMYVYFIDFKLR